MKKIILFIIIALFYNINNIQSQSNKKYLLEYKVSVEHSKKRFICARSKHNRYLVKAVGSEGFTLVEDADDHSFYDRSIEASVILTDENSVNHIEYSGFINDKRCLVCFSNCNDGATTHLTKINIKYPCFEYFKKNFMTSNHQKIKSEIKLKLTPILDPLKFEGTTEKQMSVCEDKPVKIKATQGFPSSVYKWQFLDVVNEKTVETDAYKELKEEERRLASDYADCMYENYNSTENCTPEKRALEDVQFKINSLNPKTEKRPVWRNLTSMNGSSTLSLKLSDLYSSESDRNKAFGKLISIRLKPDCIREQEAIDKSVTISFSPKMPEILTVEGGGYIEHTPLKCYDDKLDKFAIYFNRALKSGEKIYVNLYDSDATGDAPPIDQEIIDNDPNSAHNKLTKINANKYKFIWKNSDAFEKKQEGYKITLYAEMKKADSNMSYCKNSNNYKFNFTIPKPVKFTITDKKDQQCYKDEGGKLTINVEGGTNKYKYSIDNGASWNDMTIAQSTTSTVTLTNLQPKEYTILVKDSNNCEGKYSGSNIVTIKPATQITHTVESFEHPGAPGLKDATVTIKNVSGGNANTAYAYTILLNGSSTDVLTGTIHSNSSISKAISGLPAGKHIIKYKDDNGCEQKYDLPTLIDPDPITLKMNPLNSGCYGENGLIEFKNIKGGYPKYSIELKKAGTFYKSTSNIDSEASISVEKGTYLITITDQRAGVFTETATISVPSRLAITNVKSSPIRCKGYKSTVEITATGGSGEYQYGVTTGGRIDWNNSNVFYLRANSYNAYRFVVRDKNSHSCISSASGSLKLSEPDGISLSVSDVVHNEKYYGEKNGKISVSISGGSGNYQIRWHKTGDSTFSKTGYSVDGLEAGVYRVVVSDNNSCETSKTVTINQPPKLVGAVSITKKILCKNGLGDLEVSAQGGVGSYTYQWYKDNTIIQGETDKILKNIAKGTYTVEIKDDFTSTNISKELTEPSIVQLSLAKSDVTCYQKKDGSITLSASGGSGTYFYSIDNKKTYAPLQNLNNSTITNLDKGTYTIWIKDNNDCEGESSKSIDIDEPIEVKIMNPVIVHNDIAGNSKGSISIDVSGATGSLTYLWTKEGNSNFVKTTKNIDQLPAGVYKVKVKYASNCEIVASYKVKEPLPIKVNLKILQKISCNGDSLGKLLATVTGGYPIESKPSDFKYKWYRINKDNTESLISENTSLDVFSNLKAGTYKVVVNDSKGATAQSKIEIAEPTLLVATLSNTVDIKCFGESKGGIEVAVSGGVPPYQYKWTKTEDSSFESFEKNLAAITAGTYTLEVKDSNLCKVFVKNITIKEPLKPLTIESSEVKNLKGFETNDGSISVSVSGGTPSYTYQWRVKGTSKIVSEKSKINNLKIGEYEITISDKNQCSIVKSYKITQPKLLKVVEVIQNGTILCYGNKTSSLTPNVEGGVKPYVYEWSKDSNVVSSKETLDNVGAGLYTLKITDANTISATYSYEIKQPAILEIQVTSQKHVTCYDGENGEISVQVNGGVPPYTYTWSNGKTEAQLKNIKSGVYQVTVRDKNLCELSKKVIIKQPDDGIKIERYSLKNATGYGLSNGSIEVFVKGGTASYTYEWKNAKNEILASTTSKINSLVAGSYKLTITDAQGCKLKDTNFTISQPPVLEATIKTDSIACFNGKGNLTAIAKGGVPSYKYRWYKFKNNTVIGNTSKLSEIKKGIYAVEIEDVNGNLAKYDSIVLSQPDLLKIDTLQVKDVTCYEGNDGKITVKVSGGIQPYTYIWNNGSSKNELNNVRAGYYKVTVLDKKGCSFTKDSILVKEPSTYDISKVSLVRPSGEDTKDGSIKIDIIGGAEPYQYTWKDEDGKVLLEVKQSSKKESELLSLNEGKYSLLVTDSKGCQISRTYNLANPGELLVSVKQVKKIRCNGGNDAILDIVTTGPGGNTYVWHNAKDNSIVGNRKTLTNISKGSYYVVVGNAFGMKEQSSAYEVAEPTPVKLELKSTKKASCYGMKDGSIILTAKGGSGAYEYRYRLVGDSYSNWKALSNGSKEITINNLPKGNYGIQIKDTNNCFYTNNKGNIEELIAIIEQPEELQITNEVIVSPSGFGLSNGSIEIETVGGTPTYTYSWLNSNGDELNTTNKISNIKKGEYLVKITDSNNCTMEKTYKVTEPDKLEAFISLVGVISCKDASDGSLQVKAKGGNDESYTYNWYKKGSKEIIGTGLQLKNLNKGIYYVEVEDANKNKAISSEYNLIEPSELKINLVSDYKLCGKGDDWTIKAEISGGTPPYTYLWGNGSNSVSLRDMPVGTYKVTAVDARGCKIESEISLSEPKTIAIAEQVQKPTCHKGNDGKIKLHITGGAPPYTYEWSNGKSSGEILGTPGVYTVTVKDSKGCSSPSKSIEIPDTKPIKVDLGKDVTLCNGQTYILDGRIKDGVSYKWTSTNGFTSSEDLVKVSKKGIYTVVSTNKFGCKATDEIEIKKVNENISADFMVSSQVFSKESFVAVNVSSPKPEKVTWIIPKEAQVIEQNDNYCEIKLDKKGEYEITLTTAKNGCEEFQTKKIIVLDKEIKGTDSNNPYKKPMIKSFVVYPNPSSGNFTIDVELREKNPIDVKIFSLSSSAMVSHKKHQNDKKYKLKYDISLPTSVYFVVLETIGAKQVKKIVIK